MLSTQIIFVKKMVHHNAPTAPHTHSHLKRNQHTCSFTPIFINQASAGFNKNVLT